jgi:hypothetical protein
MYSDRNVPIIPRKLVHPDMGYIEIFIDIAWNSVDKIMSTV